LSLDHQYINLLNGSHKEAFAFVIRCEGDNHDPRRFVTWCPKVIAQIGHLPPTLHDRAIEIRLRRKLPEEKVERLRHDRAAQTLIPLQRQAWSWAQAHQLALTACDPDIPASLDDRAQDNWRVLIKIAEVAGGKWPEMIQTAALQFGANPEDGERSIAILLLEDLFGLFEDAPDIDFGSGQTERRLTTAQILGELNELEDQPWQSFKHGRPLNGQELATILRPFDIRPTVLWFNNIGGSMRGYRESDFVDVFKRYLGKELDR
jgi:putative DNA primase/helicase